MGCRSSLNLEINTLNAQGTFIESTWLPLNALHMHSVVYELRLRFKPVGLEFPLRLNMVGHGLHTSI